jgi:hypothetical protein
MSSYYDEQESKVLEFAKLSGLPFVYIFTGGGCDAIYGETIKHRVYITDDASVPSPDAVHYVGVYLDNDELVGECWAANRGELLELFSKFATLDELVEFIIGDGFNGFANVGAL